MNKPRREIIIIGAGLAGLTLAYRLNQKGIRPLILEARDRIGGRIHTSEQSSTTLELGATWFADKHHHLLSLVNELNLSFEEQFYGKLGIYEAENGQVQLFEMPHQPEKTYRFSEGTSSLINALFTHINSKDLLLSHKVQSVHFENDLAHISTSNGEFEAELIINTLPPNLAINGIKYAPELPSDVKDLAAQTHTWMGESIKVGFFSTSAFWKERGIGTFYSQRGPITEMYDHSNSHGFAMKGFMHDQFIQLPKQEREIAVRQQLSNVFGEDIIKQVTYIEEAWRNEKLTFLDYPSYVGPHQNNGIPQLRAPLANGKLILAGSETASEYPGYMDGAVEAGETIADQVLTRIRRQANVEIQP